MILRRTTTPLPMDGQTFARANVWTERGYSTRTFSTPGEADRWIPTTEKRAPAKPTPVP